jgi:hypothetical protein
MLMHAEHIPSLCTLHQLKHTPRHFSPGPEVLGLLVAFHALAGENYGDGVLAQEVSD